jgi:hypothetical protein
LLDLLEEFGRGGFFLFGYGEPALPEAALEAAGIVEERGDFAGGEAAGVRNGAAEDVPIDHELRAGRGVGELGGDLGEDFDGDALEGVFGVCARVFAAVVPDGADAAFCEDVAEVDAGGGDGGAVRGA